MSDPQTSRSQRDDPVHIGIVAWQALPAIHSDSGRNIGGLETAAWLLARGLACRDSVKCSFFVRAGRSLKEKHVDRVEIVCDVDPREAIRRKVSTVFDGNLGDTISRLRPSLLWQIPYLAVSRLWRRPDPAPQEPDPRLIEHCPDAWIAMGVSRESAGVIATAKSQKRPSVLMIQSNADLDSRYATDPTFRSRYGERAADCLFAIRQASQIVCQTNQQLKSLREHFGREGVLFRNAIDPSRWSGGDGDRGDHVLWIGRYDDFHKRPHLAMKIAAGCPEIPFRMIINPSDAEIERRLKHDCPPNVTITRYVPADEMPATMSRCRVFLSTGSAQYEGFPNGGGIGRRAGFKIR